MRAVARTLPFRDREVVAEFTAIRSRDMVERFFTRSSPRGHALDRRAARRHDQRVPIYDYSCVTCEERFDELSRFDAPSPACPSCGSVETERLLSTFQVPNSAAGQRKFVRNGAAAMAAQGCCGTGGCGTHAG